ncbi:unnamed protein product [Nesidiocoris tenuis]|uniref:FYVE-type domain-containing protein n=1 Tax=Nesidiocoris tenuis TaxID=355587 RepID=A0A6H5H4G4_9HEMI|nr:unnamed protein product [Nesidiocoris tenuis]
MTTFNFNHRAHDKTLSLAFVFSIPKLDSFFLFNDILVYGNIIINKKKYNKQHVIPLEEVKLESLEDDGRKYKQCFTLKSTLNQNRTNFKFRNGWLIRTASKSFAVFAATSTEKHEWMAHIEKCIEDLLRKSGKKAAEEHAAVWVPDSEAHVCMHCKRNQFTVLNRRHHCRKCGAVVCGPCSNKKFLLPNQASKPLRVCLNCYDTLSKAKAQNNQNNLNSKNGKSPTLLHISDEGYSCVYSLPKI